MQSSTTEDGVFSLIHKLNSEITKAIDTALTWEQLSSPESNYSTVRLLVKTFSEPLEDSIIYALMINRIRFIQIAQGDLAFQALNTSRAGLCELLAIKLLRKFADSELGLVSVLTRPFSPFSGAPEDVWKGLDEEEREDVEEQVGNALEMSIVSSSKHFLSTPLAQRVIQSIHSGQVVYTSRSARSIISDNYVSGRRIAAGQSGFQSTRGGKVQSVKGKGKGKGRGGVYVYDPREAGWLDHTRLRVPKWRSIIEFINFATLTALFVWTLTTSRSEKHYSHIHLSEIIFCIYCLGFTLDEFATSNEHGWTIYLANAWNAFDAAFVGLFFLYLVLRVVGLGTRREETSALAFDLLSVGASILLPRLCFFLIKDNVLIISLKAMISDFIGFMCLAAVCFSGILFTLWTLGRENWTLKQIAWLMLQIWFGSSYLGFSASDTFHPVIGPIIMVVYAALSNTLLVTILISILSNRFALINTNAKEEHMFQRAISTVEGVKTDYIFSYPIPLNIVALVVIAPLSWVLEEGTLHRMNVFFIRVTSFPLLFLISAYERYTFGAQGRGKVRLEKGKKEGARVEMKMFDSFLGTGAESTVRAVFCHDMEIQQAERETLADGFGPGENGRFGDREARGNSSEARGIVRVGKGVGQVQLGLEEDEDEDEVEVRPEDGEGENETSRLREELRLMREGIDRLEKMI